MGEGPEEEVVNDLALWQLIDSAFPIGGFAHSNGLEACWQQGQVADAESLASFLKAILEQAAGGTLPFVLAAWRGDSFESLDALCDATLSNHIANKASRAQGRAILSAAGQIFGSPVVRLVESQIRAAKTAGHYAPAFGVVARSLSLDEGAVGRAYLFAVLRGVVSAAVRLGLVGPMEAQRLQYEASAALPAVLIAIRPPEGVAQTSPIVDLLQGNQGRLYSRLFQS